MGRRRAGYSIIELLYVILLMGIIVAMAYYRLAPALNHARVQRAATVVATDLQYAQMLAVRQRQPVVVIADGALKGYIIRLRDTAVTFRNRFFGSDADYLLDSVSVSPSTVVLFPNGVAEAPITFVLGLNGYTRQVRMTRAGQVRIFP
jgi:prepilin-type N-terminal cleavage/methylation domain-containing protein